MESYIICPSCKAHITMDSKFCKNCGTQLIFSEEKSSSLITQNPTSPASSAKNDTCPDKRASDWRKRFGKFLIFIMLISFIACVFFVGKAIQNKVKINNYNADYKREIITKIAEPKYIRFIQSNPALNKQYPPDSFDLSYEAFFEILKVLCKSGDGQAVKRYFDSIVIKERISDLLWILGLEAKGEEFYDYVIDCVVEEMESIGRSDSDKNVKLLKRLDIRMLYSYSLPSDDIEVDYPDPHTAFGKSFMMPSTALILAACFGAFSFFILIFCAYLPFDKYF